MNNWQDLEKLVKTSHEVLGIHHRRIKTRNSGFKGDNEIADFYSYYKGNLFYLEVKYTEKKSFPFSMLRPTQASGLYEASKFEGVHGVIVLATEEGKNVYLIDINEINKTIENGKMSLSKKDLEVFPRIEMGEQGELQFEPIYDIIIQEEECSWKN